MPRVKRSVVARQRTKRLLKLTKGFRDNRKNTVKMAKQAMMKSGIHAYRDRRLKKRTFRRVWVTRINVAARANGVMYSRLIRALDDKNIMIDRKILADIAVRAPRVFAAIVAAAVK